MLNYVNANITRPVFSEELAPRIVREDPYDYDTVKRSDDVYRVELPYKFVSDLLQIEIQYWTFWRPIVIAADTGLGKNTFVESCLIPHVRANGGKILLLSNRVALGRQEKKRLAKLFGIEAELEDYTDQGLDKMTQFGCLTVISYQQLESWINNGDKRLADIKNNSYDFVIADEAHYFVSDSTFNAFTALSLSFICNQFYGAVKLFMTATAQEIFPIIKRWWPAMDVPLDKYGCREPKWLLYEFAHDFSWLCPYAFESKEDLADIIRRTTEKWLIFVNSIQLGEELLELLGEGVLLTAESKNKDHETNEQFQQIVNQENCGTRVSVATAVLENGVNIKDKKVKNVAIFTNDRTQFFQMVGRVRRYPGSKINIFISNADSDYINRRVLSAGNFKKAAEIFDQNATEFFEKYIKSVHPRSNIKGAFSIRKSGEACLNPLARIKKNTYEMPFWQNIKTRYTNGETYALLNEKFSWFGYEFTEDAFAGRKEFEQSKEQLMLYLDQFEGESIGKEKQDVFREELSSLLRKTYGSRQKDKSNSAKYGLAVLKKQFSEHDLPYAINSNRGCWTVEKVDENNGYN